MKSSLKIISVVLVGLGLLGLYKGGIFDEPLPEWYDKTEEYIINPNYYIYKKYDWTTWQDSVSGRMAHDPNWFKLPADKYIPKEVPFDWAKVKKLPALYKRNAYFTHLCETEGIGYETKDFPQDIRKDSYRSVSTWFYIRNNEVPVKNMREIVKKNSELFNKILNIANQNPYINPNFGHHDWNENDIRGFDLYYIDNNYYEKKYGMPSESTFREYMLDNGDIYRINFDAKTQKYLPLEKVKKSEARYYSIYREIERPEMKKLGIYGQEGISVNRETGEVIEYYKLFSVPLYMNSLKDSKNQTPIDWGRRIPNCGKGNKLIKTLSE